MERMMKQCKLCPSITEDARYVPAIAGWKCTRCDMFGTGALLVATPRQATPVDFNPLRDDNAFVIETREILDDNLNQGLRTTIRRHRDHLEGL